MIGTFEILVILVIIILYNGWQNSKKDPRINPDFDIEDFIDNQNVFDQAADMLWRHHEVFLSDFGGTRPISFRENDSAKSVYDNYEINRFMEYSEWEIMEQLDSIKKITQISYITSKIGDGSSTFPVIVFSFAVMNIHDVGGLTLHYISECNTDNEINKSLSDTLDYLEQGYAEPEDVLIRIGDSYWYYQSFQSAEFVNTTK